MSTLSTAWEVAADASGEPTDATCDHLSAAVAVDAAPPRACVDCLREGTQWVHLRQCLSCGQVRCCDSSPRRHASAHARDDSHPLARSTEPGEEWGWCFVDELFLLQPEGA